MSECTPDCADCGYSIRVLVEIVNADGEVVSTAGDNSPKTSFGLAMVGKAATVSLVADKWAEVMSDYCGNEKPVEMARKVGK